MAEEEQDKTEEATPYKLREAKNRGQVAKSLEFNSMMVIFALLAICVIWAKGMINSLLNINRGILSHAGSLQYDVPNVVSLAKSMFLDLFTVIGPVCVIMVVISVLMNLFQTGPVFSFFPIKPDAKRLNPVSGFKRVVSKKMLFEAVKSLIKLAFFSSILFVVIKSIIPGMSNLLNSDPDSYDLILLHLATRLILSLSIAILIVAALDMLYTRWDFRKQMMMSKRELKEEVKRREGDPHVRSKIKEVQREAAKRTKSINRVPEADVLITNPTHYAVAVLYDKKRMNAPFVIAKGAGSLAQKIKYFAAKHRIPTIENKKLAQLLFRETNIDEPVPESVFAEMAKILVWAYSKSGKLQSMASGHA